MTSVNTPLLNRILNELTDFKKDMGEFKEEMYKFRNEFYEFRDNVVYDKKFMSTVQEKSDVEYLRKYITIEFPTLNTELWNFGNFYDSNGQIITDIDGCLTLNSISQKPSLTHIFGNNSKFNQHPRNMIVFTESKNQLDKFNLDMKIRQYNRIIKIIKGIKHIDKLSISANFKEMLDKEPLKRLPTEIYFIFSATDLSAPIRDFIHHINYNRLTEDIYKTSVLKMFSEHPIRKKIESEIKNKPTLIKKFRAAKTFEDFTELFISNSAFKVHQNFLSSFFIEYNEVSELYKSLHGSIGYVFHTNVYLPLKF